ncbi:MAG: metabolite traffic protein EboE [Planctomycetota bacterium]
MNSTQKTIGYCTNVHAGVTIASIQENLDKYAVAARTAAGVDELGVGLWLPAQAAKELAGDPSGFSNFLKERKLRPFTINGFPYDNFHQEVVKRSVYAPTWWQPERLEYTKQLAVILADLLPEDEPCGSISTLPIGWPTEDQDAALLDRAGAQLRELAKHLESVESSTGRRIVVAIEPEPGCILDTATDMIDWFDKHLADTAHRKYLSVCHDICHSAVMMESQADVLNRYAQASIAVGKVQVSSAIMADWQSMAAGRRQEAVEQLRQFAEDRYLHQTGRQRENGDFELAEDLPDLLAADALTGEPNEDPVENDLRWVVHFHVPIFLEHFGHLSTSQKDVIECLRVLLDANSGLEFTGHLEVETYAWSVLPESMRKRGLAEDIAKEITWLNRALVECW